MCLPAAALGLVATGLTVGSTIVGLYSQYQTGKATAAAINQQNQIQADEISAAAGQELAERARAARRERASMRAIGSEMGVNLNSGSFLAALQDSEINQYNDMGLIVQNEKGQQRARAAQARSAMSQVQIPNALGAALTIGAAGFDAYNRNIRQPRSQGAKAGANS